MSRSFPGRTQKGGIPSTGNSISKDKESQTHGVFRNGVWSNAEFH